MPQGEVSSVAETPIAGAPGPDGVSATAGADVTQPQQPATPQVQGQEVAGREQGQPQEPDLELIPRRDMDRLRSTYDRKLSQLERQLQEFQAQQVQAQQQQQLAVAQQDYFQQLLDAGYDEQAAAYFVQREFGHVSRNVELEQQVQQFQQQQAQVQRGQFLANIYEDVSQEFDLDEDAMRAATGHLDPDDPAFAHNVWKAARGYSKQRDQQSGQAAQNRQLRDGLPFPGGQGATAGGAEIFTGKPPAGMNWWDNDFGKWLEQNDPRKQRRR